MTAVILATFTIGTGLIPPTAASAVGRRTLELAGGRARAASIPAPIGAICTSAVGEAGEACADASGGSSMISLACTGFAAADRLCNRYPALPAAARHARR